MAFITAGVTVADAGIIENMGFSARKDGAQSIAADAYAKITFGTEEWDNGGCFASSTFTVPSGGAGRWFFAATTVWTATDLTNQYGLVWYEGGVARASYHTVGYGKSGGSEAHNASTSDALITNLADGDTIEVYCYNGHQSTAKNMGGNDSYGFHTHFCGFRVGS